MWCDVIGKYVFKFCQSFNYQCNYFLHYLYCINIFFTFLPYLAAAYLTLSHLFLSYLTLPYPILPSLISSHSFYFISFTFSTMFTDADILVNHDWISFTNSTWREFRKRFAVVKSQLLYSFLHLPVPFLSSLPIDVHINIFLTSNL